MLSILLIVILVLLSYLFGYILSFMYLGRYLVVPLCTILFGAVNGKAAEDFCNQCCETERGERIAKLFYLFYNAGYNCTQDKELGVDFETAIYSKDRVEHALRAVNEKLLKYWWGNERR